MPITALGRAICNQCEHGRCCLACAVWTGRIARKYRRDEHGLLQHRGGAVATASGLLFIGATDDQRFHAYESKSGKLLWEAKLPANGYANPITYMGKDGKQYVVITAQETVVAYRLP